MQPGPFVEYAYAVKTTQPNVPNNFQEAMKMPDADLWREAAEKEIKSLQDLNFYKLVPRSTVPPGQTVIGTKWIFKVKIKRTRRAWLHKADTRYVGKTTAARSLQSADRRVCGLCS